MEFVFSQGSQQLRLPVPPPEFTVQSSNMNQTVNVVRRGEINLWGPEKLDGVTIQSFFPREYGSYCLYSNFPAPWDCAKLMDNWRNSGNPIRLVIVDSKLGVDINMEVLIESFEKTMKDHSGDVYFSVTLKRYKRINLPDTTSTTVATTVRPDPPGVSEMLVPNNKSDTVGATVSTAKTFVDYTIKPGDTLWDISKEYFGQGSSWQKIFTDNKDVLLDPMLIMPGVKLTIQL